MGTTISLSKKEWFAAIKYIEPKEMEFFLEEKAAEGYMLKRLGQESLFYFEFEETMAQKCKYVVDITALPKALYMENFLNQGWEYLGKSGNCYIWRQVYTEERPKDFSDEVCCNRHSKRLGISMLLLSFLLFASLGLMIWAMAKEITLGLSENIISYSFLMATNLFFAVFTVGMTWKLREYIFMKINM